VPQPTLLALSLAGAALLAFVAPSRAVAEPRPAAAPASAGAAPSKIAVADLPGIMAAVRAPGARAVLVNVWASWCEPCREEMPELLRYYRDNRARGLRLVLVSADDEEQRADVERLLAAQGFDGPAFIKHGDEMAFINGLDRHWSGELPSTFVFDGQGTKKLFWPGTITYRELGRRVDRLLAPAGKRASVPAKAADPTETPKTTSRRTP
jgi:thiol-disulfide isomerase/thioredoxin